MSFRAIAHHPVDHGGRGVERRGRAGRGHLTTGVREMDERALIVTLPTAQAILNTSKVSKLVVVLNDTSNTDAVQSALTTSLSAAGQGVELANWSDLASFYHQVRGLYSGIFLFLGIIIVGLVVLSSGNAMSMTVMERVREIGTLMAVGTSRPLVMLMFVTEGLGLGLLGGVRRGPRVGARVIPECGRHHHAASADLHDRLQAGHRCCARALHRRANLDGPDAAGGVVCGRRRAPPG